MKSLRTEEFPWGKRDLYKTVVCGISTEPLKTFGQYHHSVYGLIEEFEYGKNGKLASWGFRGGRCIWPLLDPYYNPKILDFIKRQSKNRTSKGSRNRAIKMVYKKMQELGELNGNSIR